MKTIRFGKKEDNRIIDIDDVVYDQTKIYCSERDDKTLWFLVKIDTDQYKWCNLTSGLINNMSYPTFNRAIRKNEHNFKTLIFDSQCEVLEYAKKF